jgi:hypothetical protein
MSFDNPNQPPFTPMDYDFSRPTNVDLAGDYTDSKPGLGKIYKENAIASPWGDEEPLITPEKLKRIHLFGIPLVSSIKNPLTGRPEIMDDTLIKQYIIEAVSLAEAESKVEIFPRQYCEKQAFDRVAYESFGYMLLRHRPVCSLESITVTPSNEVSQFKIPNEWVDIGNLHLGQLSLIPLTLFTRGGGVVPLTSGPAGSFFLSLLASKPWVPALFEIVYSSGFKEGCLPKIVNQLIGVTAAMEILSALAATYSRSNSTSLGIDGLSQSVSTPGSDIFTVRLTQLAEKRQWIKSRIQSALGMNFIIDNV